jgi:hypothetical protein
MLFQYERRVESVSRSQEKEGIAMLCIEKLLYCSRRARDPYKAHSLWVYLQ